MKKFKELDTRSVNEVDNDILKYWDSIDILKRSIETRNEEDNFVFYDGPIYANAMPGLHHLYGKNIKDAFCKYYTMNGKRVLRKIGLDTHGLPIEVNVEKKLGFHSKLDIENFGIDKFNLECKKATDTNVSDVCRLTHMMGQFIDTKNPYITCSNDYIESEWWILKKFADAGLLYHTNKVLPYCTRCGTELSANEVAQEYKEISVNTVYVKFKLKDSDTYVLVWTTTPWTLIANVALCVNPEEEYIKVKSDGVNYIVASMLADKVLTSEYEIIETYKGKDLEYLEYEQLIPELSVDKKAFYITCDTYVTMTDGTGIVHIAPAFGVDDSNVAKKYDLPVLNPVGTDGKYKEGPWKDRIVYESELEIDIIKYLAGNNLLYKKEKIKHNYPHCWRCKTPLLYYAKPAWYIKTTAYKDKIIEANKKVNWYPNFVGEKRFANWLENLVDWCISRNRYWGAPLPVWTCECGHIHTIGSIDELIELSIEKLDRDEIDLHRPYVDNIHIKCSKCGKPMIRVKDVLDVWFDSGSMPYAQYHYPFENKELFKNQFPADFISEGIDQTRGWFYVLLVISTFISGQSAFKNVLVNDLLLDAEGKKMSKSKGNVIEPFSTLEKYGADIVRFYLLYVSPVWTPLKFDMKGLSEVHSKFFNPLKNTYNFFVMYANTDDVDPREYSVDYKDRDEIDRWLLSKYNRLIKNVVNSFNEYDLNKVTKYLSEFVSEDLSNWYIRRNRKRFWGSDLDISKKSVYLTTYEVLVGLSKLLAPISPFLSEEIYRNLTGLESVHLADYPVCNSEYIDEELENRMDLVIDFISMGRNSRDEAKIKVRQPIQDAIIDSKYKNIIGDMEELIKEELNVKEVKYIDDMSEYMNISYRPNYREAGKYFGSDIKAFADYLNNIKSDDISKLNNGNLKIKLNDNVYDVTSNLVDVRISSKDGYDVVTSDDKAIILNTDLTYDLICEGLARETVSKIQQIRKNNGYDIVDRINIYYSSNDEYANNISNYTDFIKDETLAININREDNIDDKISINDYVVGIRLEVVKK
jgi:isoleucyl-tRNA synthetase